MPSTRLMCSDGDVTLAWDDDNAEMMIGLIKKKMEEGMSFFIVTPRLGGLIRPKRTPVKKNTDLTKHNAVVVSDADFGEMIAKGVVSSQKAPSGQIETIKRADTPEEAAKSDTVAVRPARGG